MSVPTLRVRQREPADELGQLAIASWPNQHVPMIGQHAVGQQSRFGPFNGLPQHLLERLVVPVVLEDCHPRVRAVQDVVNVASLGGSVRSSHATILPTQPFSVNKWFLTPF